MVDVLEKLHRFSSNVAWYFELKKFKKVGKNCRIGTGFSIREPEYITIGDNFEGGKNISIHAWKKYRDIINERDPKITIGDNVSMTNSCYISCSNEITISDGVLIGVGTYISDNSHGKNIVSELEVPPNQRPLFSKGRVFIGRNVWIGRNVCVMPNVNIGEGSIIGANSVVTHSIPSHVIAAGVPARVIKEIK